MNGVNNDWIDEIDADEPEAALVAPAAAAQEAPAPAPPPAPVPAARGWLRLLKRTDKGVVVKTLDNLRLILLHQWGDVIRYNEMTHSPEFLANGQWSPCDTRVSTDVRCSIERDFGLSYGAEPFEHALASVAHHRVVHPVRDYLTGVRWDGVSRLSDVLRVLGAEDSAINRRIISCWFQAAIARPLDPGVKVDTVLVLIGKQGSRKSTFFNVLAGAWFCDSYMDITNKDAYLQLHSAWIYEWGEIEKVTGARSADQVKAFLTSQCDTFRAPYDRTTKTLPRSSIFIGTTNDERFLSDCTGNRRFWPLATGARIDIEWVKANRDQLWAEAMHLRSEWFRDNPDSPTRPWVLTDEETADLDARTTLSNTVGDPWEDDIDQFLYSDRAHAWPRMRMSDQEMVFDPRELDAVGNMYNRTTARPLTTALLLGLGLNIKPKDVGAQQQRRLGNLMRTQGWKQVVVKTDGRCVRAWVPDTADAVERWHAALKAPTVGQAPAIRPGQHTPNFDDMINLL